MVSAGSVELNQNNTYTGGTIVNGGTLALGVGGGAGSLVGTLTINPGGTVNSLVQDGLGYNSGTSVTQVNINRGVINQSSASNLSYITNYTLDGGTISSTGGGYYNFSGGQTIATTGTNISSVITAGIDLRSSSGLNFNVASGSVPSGIDLLVSGIITNGAYPIAKQGAGLMALTGANAYTGVTAISQGTLQIGAARPATPARWRSQVRFRLPAARRLRSTRPGGA